MSQDLSQDLSDVAMLLSLPPMSQDLSNLILLSSHVPLNLHQAGPMFSVACTTTLSPPLQQLSDTQQKEGIAFVTRIRSAADMHLTHCSDIILF